MHVCALFILQVNELLGEGMEEGEGQEVIRV